MTLNHFAYISFPFKRKPIQQYPFLLKWVSYVITRVEEKLKTGNGLYLLLTRACCSIPHVIYKYIGDLIKP